MAEIEDLPIRSMNAVGARNKQAWLDLFEPYATVEDPVGGHPQWDPDGRGFEGREAIGRFYDIFSANPAAMEFELHHLVACGQEVAAFVTLRMSFPNGSRREQKMINCYKASVAGKIVSLRSFWR